MKVVITKDDGSEIVFKDVSDCYISVRQLTTVVHDKQPKLVVETKSWSWGGNVRELVKEIQQSLVELQEYLRSKNASNS